MDTPNFKISEFRCPCCKDGDKVIKPDLLEALQKLRDLFQKPMRISSGYRCPEHNKTVSGASCSAHLTGHAADIEDFERHLQHFCTPEILERCGLWAEGFEDTPVWVHLQVRPAAQRIFKK